MRCGALALAAAALAACTDPVAPPPVPVVLAVLKAAPAVTTPGAQVDTISVRLLDAQGRPVPGQRVEWSGDGLVAPHNSVTDELGLARASWILPRYRPALSANWAVGPSGEYHVTARVDGVEPASFTTTARAFVVEKVDASSSYACGVRQGELWCWGYNPWPLAMDIGGRLPRRVELPAGMTVVDVRVGENMVCVLDRELRPYCTARELDGDFLPVSSVDGMLDLVDAERFACGRTLQRAVSCWDVDGPRALVGLEKMATPATSIAGGGRFACASTDIGEAWCWGRNDHGQLGDGSTADSEQPVRVLAPVPFVRVVAGWRGACGFTATEEIWCWGRAVLPDESWLPRRVAIPGVQGPAFDLGSSGEGYTWNGGTLYTWFNGGFVPLAGLTEQYHRVIDASMTSQGCIRTDTSELFCSWILLYGGGDTTSLPSELVPVPDPASQVNP